MHETLLEGAYDLHIHAGPDIFPRSMTDIEIARLALARNMRGVLLKCHDGSSVMRASIANKSVGSDIVLSSLTLNTFVGGFNPAAAFLAAEMGAKILYMPTITARNHLNHYGKASYTTMENKIRLNVGQPLSALDADGALLPCVREILAVARDYNIAVATSHLSLLEIRAVLLEGLALGLKKMIITHPDAPFIGMSMSEQCEWARRGVFIEKAALWLLPVWKCASPEDYISSIIKISARHCILTSDLGSVGSALPVTGFGEFLEELFTKGLPEDDLRIMVIENPAWITS